MKEDFMFMGTEFCGFVEICEQAYIKYCHSSDILYFCFICTIVPTKSWKIYIQQIMNPNLQYFVYTVYIKMNMQPCDD